MIRTKIAEPGTLTYIATCLDNGRREVIIDGKAAQILNLDTAGLYVGFYDGQEQWFSYKYLYYHGFWADYLGNPTDPIRGEKPKWMVEWEIEQSPSFLNFM